ncbi:MAG: dihydroneopterin aldolase [Candidatus Kapabacteria bacterium]|nr:dihydroneopterin aldolase [Candidatus Kapabacteria bacterium]
MSKTVSPIRITISNAEFYGYHGVKAEERSLGGQFQVDVDVIYDPTQAVLSDDVQVAVNYEEVMFCISEVVSSDEPYNLIETVTYEVLNSIMDKFPTVLEATCRVRKLNVPIRQTLDYIECELTMERD